MTIVIKTATTHAQKIKTAGRKVEMVSTFRQASDDRHILSQ